MHQQILYEQFIFEVKQNQVKTINIHTRYSLLKVYALQYNKLRCHKLKEIIIVYFALFNNFKNIYKKIFQ